MLTVLRRYPQVSAWNEHDEGHWICPSLRNGTAKLRAIQAGILAAGVDRRQGNVSSGLQ